MLNKKENKKMKNNDKIRLRMQELLDTNPKEFHEKLEESFGRLEKLYSERDETKFAEDLISKINNYWTILNCLNIPSIKEKFEGGKNEKNNNCIRGNAYAIIYNSWSFC